ncbi:unnamed protein product [Pleuronectes platessa]|uniref:Uncharacterized protein n=1 Tax=Pleuronectes platessa TaxID=8262 RepID=A0A9N7US69_PLEPL|nr:unnamed protein product [Pleuronectes platessa]
MNLSESSSLQQADVLYLSFHFPPLPTILDVDRQGVKSSEAAEKISLLSSERLDLSGQNDSEREGPEPEHRAAEIQPRSCELSGPQEPRGHVKRLQKKLPPEIYSKQPRPEIASVSHE